MSTALKTPPVAAAGTNLRRITEADPDYQKLHATTTARLARSLRQYIREEQRGEQGADSRFIQRHTKLMKQAYIAAHHEGQKDYWPAVSKRTVQHRFVQPDPTQVQDVMGKRADIASILKMAHQVKSYVAQQKLGALSEPIRLADAPAHTGVMVAFMLKQAVAKKLAIPNGEPASDMHLTLTFHGDSSDMTAQQLEDLREAVAKYSVSAAPLHGTVSGVGRFNPSPSSDGKVPVIALVNVPGIQQWRADLNKSLGKAGFPADETFAYTPHITLAYIDEDAEMPVKRVRKVALEFDAVTLAIGGKHYTYPLGEHSVATLSDSWMLAAPVTDLPGDYGNRVAMQGQIVWTGLQDGYSDAGGNDSATPYSELYWQLGPVLTEHCADCPELAMGSPYDPPWAGAGSNQLNQTPGDGQTDCGAACKCTLSYSAPQGDALAELGKAIQSKWNDWYPTGYDAAGNVLTQPITPPAAGDELTDAQKSALDDFRNSSDMWDTVRRNLPPMPTFFGTDDLPSPLPAWENLTAEQQAVVQRVEEAHEAWLNAAGALVPPPVFHPDPALAQRAWLEAAGRGEFTPWWKDYQEPPSPSEVNAAWFEWMAGLDWPDPHLADPQAEMDAWLNWAAQNLAAQKAGTDINTDFRASEPEQESILLYNPNHGSDGRFTYGSNAKTTVARGQGKSRRSAGGKRVTNTGVHAGLSKPGSTGAPSARKAGKIINDDDLEHEDQKIDDLTQRLAGNAAFESLAAARGQTPDEMAVQMYGDWGMSSNAVNSQALQMAVRDEFGLVGTSDIRQVSNTDQLHQVRLEPKSAEEMYAEHGDGYRAFARAQYEATQDYLASKGISSLTVYRGSAYDDDSGKGGINWGHSGTASISTRPISSFSTNPDIGDEFASMGTYQLTISADIPSSRVFSFSMTGLGEGYQSELLILGGTDRWSYDSRIEE